MEKTKAILAGILAGLAAPASHAQCTHYERLNGSDLSRMRGDVARVGMDFNNVISRQSGKKDKQSNSLKFSKMPPSILSILFVSTYAIIKNDENFLIEPHQYHKQIEWSAIYP